MFDYTLIREAMKDIASTHKGRADALGVTYASATNYFHGYREMPEHVVVRLARKRGIDVEEFRTP